MLRCVLAQPVYTLLTTTFHTERKVVNAVAAVACAGLGALAASLLPPAAVKFAAGIPMLGVVPLCVWPALPLWMVWVHCVHVSYAFLADGSAAPYRVSLKAHYGAHQHHAVWTRYPAVVSQQRADGPVAVKLRSHPRSGWAPTLNVRGHPAADAPVVFLLRVHDLVECLQRAPQGDFLQLPMGWARRTFDRLRFLDVVSLVPGVGDEAALRRLTEWSMTCRVDRAAPKQRSTVDEKVAAGEECGICLEAYLSSRRKPIAVLHECGHFFHEACIERWLGEQQRCPLCGNGPAPRT